MKARDTPLGWGDWWPHWCINYALICIFSPINTCILRVLSYKLVNLICKLRSKRRVSSDHAGMKTILGEVSIFCLWTNWIHLVTCSKMEFRELYYCSRWTLDKICEIYSFDRCSRSHGRSSQKSFLTCGDAKKVNLRTTKLFLKHVF